MSDKEHKVTDKHVYGMRCSCGKVWTNLMLDAKPGDWKRVTIQGGSCDCQDCLRFTPIEPLATDVFLYDEVPA